MDQKNYCYLQSYSDLKALLGHFALCFAGNLSAGSGFAAVYFAAFGLWAGRGIRVRFELRLIRRRDCWSWCMAIARGFALFGHVFQPRYFYCFLIFFAFVNLNICKLKLWHMRTHCTCAIVYIKL